MFLNILRFLWGFFRPDGSPSAPNPRQFYSGDHPFNHPPEPNEDQLLMGIRPRDWPHLEEDEGWLREELDKLPEFPNGYNHDGEVSDEFWDRAKVHTPADLLARQRRLLDEQRATIVKNSPVEVESSFMAMPDEQFEELSKELESGLTEDDIYGTHYDILEEPTVDDILEEFSDRSEELPAVHVAGIPMSQKMVVEVPASTQNTLNSRTKAVSLPAVPDFAALAREKRQEAVSERLTIPQQVRQAYRIWKDNPTPENFSVLYLAKTRARRPWLKLGLSPEEVAAIEAYRTR